MIIHEKGYEGKNRQEQLNEIRKNYIEKEIKCSSIDGCGTTFHLLKEDIHLIAYSSKLELYFISCPVCTKYLFL